MIREHLEIMAGKIYRWALKKKKKVWLIIEIWMMIGKLLPEYMMKPDAILILPYHSKLWIQSITLYTDIME